MSSRFRAAGVAVLAMLAPPLPVPAAETDLVSVNSLGEQSDARSAGPPAISGDGRLVVFTSWATNLVPGEAEAAPAVYLRDVEAGETVAICHGAGGEPCDGESSQPAISADGRYVAFISKAPNLSPNGAPAHSQAFVLDRATGEMLRISESPDGHAGDGDTSHPELSADGRFTVFLSAATNLVPAVPANNRANVFLHDRTTGQITWITPGVDALGADCRNPAIAGNGAIITFAATTDNLTEGDSNGLADVFLHDVPSGTTQRLSLGPAGADANGASGLSGVALSADGRFVVYDSAANNLGAIDSNGFADIFLHDRDSGGTRRVSVTADGTEANGPSETPTISADGTYVFFASAAVNLSGVSSIQSWTIYAHEVATGRLAVATPPLVSALSNDIATRPTASLDGRFVAFESTSAEMVDDDANGQPDVFRRDRGDSAPTVHRNVYVDQSAPAGGDGTTWARAFDNLQDALGKAEPGDVLRVAQGTYLPAPLGGSPAAYFCMKDHVQLLGGYAGIGSTNPDQRDPDLFPTILSGDQAQNDEPISTCCAAHAPASGCEDVECTATVCAYAPACCSVAWTALCAQLAEQHCPQACARRLDNSNHVIVCIDKPVSTVIDGVTIRQGNAEGGSGGVIASQPAGGGAFIAGGAPIFRNCRFVQNWARYGGAVAIHRDGAPAFLSCEFSSNSGGEAGGAVESLASPRFERCSFEANASESSGGAIYSSGPFIGLDTCSFNANTAASRGGALASYTLAADIRNCRFTSNSAGSDGGAIVSGGGNAVLQGSVFLNNASEYSGGAIQVSLGTILLRDSSFLQNTARLEGGALHLGRASADVHGCLFAHNSANNGGGINRPQTGLPITITHSTFYANTASAGGGGAYLLGSAQIRIANSVLWGNRAAPELSPEGQQLGAIHPRLTYTCIGGLDYYDNEPGQVGNIGLDPLFSDPFGADGMPGTLDDDLRLAAGSPCIDSANNAAVPADLLDADGDGDLVEPTPFDADGRVRFWDDPAAPDCPQPNADCGDAPLADMGAYEFGTLPPVPGDYDHNGAVEPADAVWFATCMTGPAAPSLPSSPCRRVFDFDRDDDIDLGDFGAFLQATTAH